MTLHKIINTEFETIGSATCDELASPSCGRMAFRSRDKEGFLDLESNIVIEAQYEGVTDFWRESGLSKVMCKREGHHIYGLIDISGRVVLEPRFRDMSDPHEGLIAVLNSNSDNLRGYMTVTGQVVIPPTFRTAEKFSCGLAPAATPSDWENDELYFIDHAGKKALGPFQHGTDYVKASFRDDGITCVVDCCIGKRVLTDTRGRVVATGWGNFKINDYAGGIVEVYEEINESTFRVGYTNVNGDFIVPPQCDEPGVFTGDYILAKINGFWTLYDIRGRQITDMQFDNSDDVTLPTCAILVFAETQKNGDKKWRYLNLVTGKLSPLYETAQPFSEGFAVVT
ncbi:MAG: WG repeat-containing protein [Gemmataceae bacterium]